MCHALGTDSLCSNVTFINLVRNEWLVTREGLQVTRQSLAYQRQPEATWAHTPSEKIHLYVSPGIKLK